MNHNTALNASAAFLFDLPAQSVSDFCLDCSELHIVSHCCLILNKMYMQKSFYFLFLTELSLALFNHWWHTSSSIKKQINYSKAGSWTLKNEQKHKKQEFVKRSLSAITQLLLCLAALTGVFSLSVFLKERITESASDE